MSDTPTESCCQPFVRRWWWTAFLTIPAMTLIGAILGGGMVYQSPAQYEAYATLESLGDESDVPDWSALSDTTWLSAVSASASSSELITRNDPTGNFQLGYRAPDPNEAATVANAVASQWVRQGDRVETSGAPLFQGRVVIQINPEVHDWRIFNHDQPSGGNVVPADFVATQMEVIHSKKTLYVVVHELKLHEKWDLELTEAYQRVKDRLSVEREIGTSLIVIEYLDEDPVFARDIANAVAKCYRDRRTNIESLRSSAALDTLQKQLKDQQDKVEEARLRMLDLAERYRIIDMAALNNQASVTGDPVTGRATILMSSMQDTYQAEANIAVIKMQIDTLAGLADEALIEAVASLDLPNMNFENAYSKYVDLRVQREAIGDEHPDNAEIQSELAKSAKLLKETATTIRRTLKTKLDMAEQAMVLAKDLEESKKDDSMDERRKVAEYSESSKEYELQKSMLANMQSKFATETVDLTMPKTPITVHEEAEVASSPAAASLNQAKYRVLAWAAPNRQPLAKPWALYLLCGSALGLLLGLVLTVPVMRLHQGVFG